MGRQSYRKTRQIRIDDEIHHAIKMEAAVGRKTIKAIVESALYDFLGLDDTLLGVEKKEALKSKYGQGRT